MRQYWTENKQLKSLENYIEQDQDYLFSLGKKLVNKVTV